MYFIVYLLESLCSKGTGVSHELYVSNTGGWTRHLRTLGDLGDEDKQTNTTWDTESLPRFGSLWESLPRFGSLRWR
jgi:hypothetical protein